MSTFYVTTPIYYVNGPPHIGHTYTTLVADTVARYRRLCGDDVRFLTGTDEHGQKIERAAGERGLEPQELADRMAASFRAAWEAMGISHDDFIRTTEARHRPAVEAMIRKIDAAGDLYTARHEGWYCASCELFYTDKELVGGELCPVHETPAEWKSEENVFFRLSRYEEPLLELYREQPGFVRPETRLNEVRSFVEGGLKDLSVSRADLDWGIPFPGHPGQTVYVWLDALTNYVSALGFGRPEASGGETGLYERYWAADRGPRLHLVGKDILRFHAVYWPAFLMSAGVPLPTTVHAHGWWLRDEKKVSKSGGNLVRVDHLVERFGTDALRFFLLREMAFGQDARFSDEAFVERYNAELANGLGNTVSRLTTLSRRAFDGKTPPESCGDNPLVDAAATAVADYREAMDELAFHKAIEALERLLGEANQYLTEHAPWKIAKTLAQRGEDGGEETEALRGRLSRVLWNGLEAARIVTVGLLPVLPETAPRVLAALGSPRPPESLDALEWGRTPTSALLPEPEPLFPRIDRDAFLAEIAAPEAAAPAETEAEDGEMIDIEQFMEVELLAGTVVEAEAIPKSSKLLKLRVDLGEETPRQVVAGIAKQYEPESLLGRQVVVVANLKPAKLMGIESQGMVLAATDDGKPVLLHPEAEVPNGSRVR